MVFKIPLFNLSYDSREEDAILEVLRSRWISMGPKCQELEKIFSRRFEVQHAVAVSNCTSALHMALRIIGVKPGDEVIVPSLTFVATVNAILYLDAIPKFCDVVSVENPTIDPEQIERLVNKRTKAIVVMHYGGFPCNMDKICSMADYHRLKIIEDACHAPLSEYKGKKLGTVGDIGCFSFFSNKNISAAEGGMLLTHKEEYAKKARLLRSHGMTTLSYERSKGHASDYDVIDIGYNYRIDDLRASLAIVQLMKLDKDIEKRARVRERYISTLKELVINGRLVIPFQYWTDRVANYIFPVVLKDSSKKSRSHIRDKLQLHGIQTSIHYPAVHRFSLYRQFARTMPVTEFFSDQEITLPMYSALEDNHVEYIAETLKSAIA